MGFARSFSIAAAVDTPLLMLTTGIAFYFAFYFAFRRKIQQHRQWMTPQLCCGSRLFGGTGNLGTGRMGRQRCHRRNHRVGVPGCIPFCRRHRAAAAGIVAFTSPGSKGAGRRADLVS
jgi:hypothetical protein